MTPLPLPRVASTLPDAIDLLTRLMALVGIGIAHLELHPESYQSPTGRILRAAIEEEAVRLLGRVKSTL